MEPKGHMNVVDLTRACGVSGQAVRLYEREGLLPPVGRSAKGYRLYDTRSLETLQFIKRAQRCGFRLAEIRALLQTNTTDPDACSSVKALLDQKIQDIIEKIADLQGLRDVLQNLRAACDGEPGPGCPAFIRLCAPNGALPNPKTKGGST